MYYALWTFRRNLFAVVLLSVFDAVVLIRHLFTYLLSITHLNVILLTICSDTVRVTETSDRNLRYSEVSPGVDLLLFVVRALSCWDSFAHEHEFVNSLVLGVPVTAWIL